LPQIDCFGSNVPVLMLKGRGEEADRIVGLELGADDYLPKAFSTRELPARLRATIRRSNVARMQGESGEPGVVVGELRIAAESRCAVLILLLSFLNVFLCGQP
jgi:DNA-binding response OmpR family regulator